MSIGVFSFYELFTTAVGWMLYDAFYRLLTVTGIAWFPFAYAIYHNWRRPMESQEAKDAAIVSLRRMMWDIGTMILITAFAVTPFGSIDMRQLHYQCAETALTQGMACAQGQGATMQSSNSQWDNFNFAGAGVPTSAKVPVLWGLTMAFSGGINRAAIAAMPKVADIAPLQAMAKNIQLNDPAVASELSRFMSECYLPARNKVNRVLSGETPTSPEFRDALRQAVAENPSDLDWPGSKILQMTPGLYTLCFDANTCGEGLRATKPVGSWPVDNFRDTENDYDPQQSVSVPAGRPRCDQWWLGSDGQQGLQDKLVDQASLSMYMKGPSSDPTGYVQAAVSKIAGTYQEMMASWTGSTVDDAAVKAGLARTLWDNAKVKDLVPDDPAYQLGPDAGSIGGSIKNGLKNTFGAIGASWEEFTNDLKMPLMVRAGPMIQALLILALLASAPFLAVLGNYRIENVFIVLVGYMTIRFWTVLWALALWMYQTAMALTMPPGCMDLAVPGVPSQCTTAMLARAVDGTTASNTLIDLTAAGMYVGMPILFSLFMSWVGVQGMSMLSSAMSSGMAAAERAGQRAANVAQNVATTMLSGGAGMAAGAAAGATVTASGGTAAQSAAASSAASRAVSGMTSKLAQMFKG